MFSSVSRPAFQEFQTIFRKSSINVWQLNWDMQADDKLHAIKPALEMGKSTSRMQRRFEVLLCRLRVGHSRLTHPYLHCGENVEL